MASTSLHETAGLSFRMSRQRDRELWEALDQKRDVGEKISERGRTLLGLGRAAERALEQNGISVKEETDVDDDTIITDPEAFVEVAVGREIDRYGAGNLRMQLGDPEEPTP